jgi:peptidoglycan/LPS O-acetylase OafA/YrhL
MIGLHNFRGYRKSLQPLSQPINPSSDKVFFPNLDGLRFLSFFLVFLQHGFADVINNINSGGFIVTTIKIGIFQSAQLGVSFFFVLSGFLITYLLLAEKNKRGRIDVKAFYVRRALRIWPLYFGLLITIFFIIPLFHTLQLPKPLLYFTFLSNFDVVATGGRINITDITWSVAIEEQFYLVWPLLFFFINSRFYVFIFPAIIVVSAFYRFKHSSDSLTIFFHTFSVMSELAIGGLTAYCVATYPRFVNFFRDLTRPTLFAIYTLILPFLIFSRFLYVYSTIGKIILGIIIAFIITEQNFSTHSLIKMERFKTISEWGKYTYGLYLLHPLVIFFVLLFAQKQGWDSAAILPGIFIGLVCFAVSVFVCYLSYNYFEKPFLDLKRRFSHIQTGSTTDKKSIEVKMESELDADGSALRTGQ